MLNPSKLIGEPSAKQVVTATAGNTVGLGLPVGLYLDVDGNLMCFKNTADATTVSFGTGKWGIVSGGDAFAIGSEVEVTIAGKAKCVSGGTPGQLITQVDDSGDISSSAVSTTTIDNNLGTVTVAGEMYIY
tara:strand:+ start:1244 stop:1636 length:393 start_codon:yes stop_codon:yes gene_type:complete